MEDTKTPLPEEEKDSNPIDGTDTSDGSSIDSNGKENIGHDKTQHSSENKSDEVSIEAKQKSMTVIENEAQDNIQAESDEPVAENPVDNDQVKETISSENKEDISDKNLASDSIKSEEPETPGEIPDKEKDETPLKNEDALEISEIKNTDVKEPDKVDEEKAEDKDAGTLNEVTEAKADVHININDSGDLKSETNQDDTISEVSEKSKDEEPKVKKEAKVDQEEDVIDYSELTKEGLVNLFIKLLQEKDAISLKEDIENIKVNFYKKHKAEIEQTRWKFFEDGGEPQDFKVEDDPLEVRFKDLLKRYKKLKAEFNNQLDIEKQDNLKKKYDVIEQIKELVNRKESINHTFQEFKDLQNQWREIGLVPQDEVKNLWETYNYHVEKFYDYIKINKELRDLDLKKNQEQKVVLCEKAEELLLEPSIKNAFQDLQKLHDQWREIGPVPNEKKDEIWERFREATTKINKKHQEYYISLKEDQKRNLEAKTLICEKIEEIAESEIPDHNAWNKKSSEVIELQKMWKTIGFAPKKFNNEIFERYKKACDEFFNKKKEFYKIAKGEQDDNLQLKTELCMRAEAIKDNTDWKTTTEEFIKIQNQWKQIGQIPRKKSDAIWKRFRAACDHFFNKKSEYFESIDSIHENNMNAKLELIQRVEKFEAGEDVKSDLELLKKFQKEWTEIGHVPIKKKAELQTNFRNAINKGFDSLNADEKLKSRIKFKTRIDDLLSGPNSKEKIWTEREKIVQRLKKLEGDMAVWENNIGFFSNSKNAESLIKDVRVKIDTAKESITILKQKLDMIDKLG